MAENNIKIDYEALNKAAIEARQMAYVPYSNFAVGAALLTADGKIYKGCNIENAAFGPTNCGERTAIFKAVSEGERDFVAISIAGWAVGDDPEEYAYPCGVCRQVMMEFTDPEDFEIVVCKSTTDYKKHTLAELLPMGFGPANLA